jgi:hypothetical protein
MKYDREVVANTIRAMTRVAEIQGRRQERFMKNRMKGRKTAEKLRVRVLCVRVHSIGCCRRLAATLPCCGAGARSVRCWHRVALRSHNNRACLFVPRAGLGRHYGEHRLGGARHVQAAPGGELCGDAAESGGGSSESRGGQSSREGVEGTSSRRERVDEQDLAEAVATLSVSCDTHVTSYFVVHTNTVKNEIVARVTSAPRSRRLPPSRHRPCSACLPRPELSQRE